MTARYRVESDLVPSGTRWVVKWSHPRWTIAAFKGPGADKSAAQVAKLLNAHATDDEPSKWESPSVRPTLTHEAILAVLDIMAQENGAAFRGPSLPEMLAGENRLHDSKVDGPAPSGFEHLKAAPGHVPLGTVKK